MNANLPVKSSCQSTYEDFDSLFDIYFSIKEIINFTLSRVLVSVKCIPLRTQVWRKELIHDKQRNRQPEVVHRFFGKRGGSLSSFSFLLKNIKYDIDLIIVPRIS